MTDDIVKELRQYKQVKCWTCSEWGCYDDDGKHHWKEEECVCDCHVSPVAAAADEIERLQAELNKATIRGNGHARRAIDTSDEVMRLRSVIARYVAADEDLRGPVVVGGWRKFSWGDREFYEARDGLWVEAKGDAGV